MFQCIWQETYLQHFPHQGKDIEICGGSADDEAIILPEPVETYFSNGSKLKVLNNSTNFALFIYKLIFLSQTYLLGDQSAKSMGQRYSELVKARELGSAFIGPDNKIVDPGQSNRSYSPSMVNQFYQNSVKSKAGRSQTRPPSRPPSGRGRPSGPKPKEDEFPCTKCNSKFSRLFRTINHLKQGLFYCDIHFNSLCIWSLIWLVISCRL